MFRLILLGLLFATPALAVLPTPGDLHPSAAFQPRGPELARGALVWLPGSPGEIPPPIAAEPGWVRHAAEHGYDIWGLGQVLGQPAPDQLASGIAALRAGGYRRIIVAGQSGGAWTALTVLAHPGLANGIAAFSPTGRSTGPEQQPRALAAFDALMHEAGHSPDTRLVIALFADDPLDPDPQARQDIIRDVARRQGLKLQPLFLLDQPRGHEGVYDPAFDRLFGARIVRFLDPEAKRAVSAPPAPP